MKLILSSLRSSDGVDPAIHKPIKNALLINCENRQTQERAFLDYVCHGVLGANNIIMRVPCTPVWHLLRFTHVGAAAASCWPACWLADVLFKAPKLLPTARPPADDTATTDDFNPKPITGMILSCSATPTSYRYIYIYIGIYYTCTL